MKKTNISDIQDMGLSAYRKLKYEVYYETYDLYIKETLAKFECSKLFEKELDKWNEWLKNPQSYLLIWRSILGRSTIMLYPKSIHSQVVRAPKEYRVIPLK